MIASNCIVTVTNLSGDETLKQRTTNQTGIRATIVPASQEVAVLHDVPVGQAFSILINGQITGLTSDAKITVTDAFISSLVAGDVFNIKGAVRVDAVLGNSLYSALGVKVSD